MRKRWVPIFFGLLFLTALADATIFGLIRGIVHDPQHHPIPGASVTLKAQNSQWVQTTKTNDNGEFEFAAVPIGEYTVTVVLQGFHQGEQTVVVKSDSSPVLHIALNLATVKETTVVSEQAETVSADSVTTTTLVSREDIEKTPGADRTNSLAMITDYVPGAYVTHDQLHIGGGHQVSWLVDGVPVPNANIAGNVGPQFDPKDIDYLEVQRGGFDAEYGDRTYGVFNVVPRTGFERDKQGELISSFGNFYQTNDQINFGGHTQRFAYYASFNGNRSNLGLQSPVGQILHDLENGFGGFSTLIYNVDAKNQLRLVTSLRRDFYQIPNTPDQETTGTRDAQREADAFVNFSWVKTFGHEALLTVSPFYHYNSANFEGGPHDFPISTTDNRGSQYAGGQATLSAKFWKNNAAAGFYGYGQHDNQVFGLIFNDQSNPNFRNPEHASGGVEALFLEDKIRVAPWLTLTGGVRQTHFSGGIVENATSPRAGVAIKIPHLNWVVRAFYGQFYQPPPLLTASGPLLQFVTDQNLGFIPLRGERDEQTQVGLAIPFKGWLFDMDSFRTRARNFFDHNPVGNSDVFFPITIDGALVRGWELTVRSPKLWRRGQVHLAYSNQIAQGRGAVSGGLTNFSPPSGFFLLDHDQRNTLNVGFNVTLPWKAFAAGNAYYGSGFSNGSPPPSHLPGHTTLDLTLGRAFGERVWVSLNVLNIANRHLLLDNSLTFGGTHFNNPREIYAEVRYKFHY